MDAGVLTKDKLRAISDLIRLPKQYGTLLVLWPTLWSLFIASHGRPDIKMLAIFILGTFLMRSAGCAVNDIADRNFDGYVERTKGRPLASGRLKLKEAIAVFVALSLLAFVLVLFLNRLAIALSFIGIFIAVVYPFVKRVSHWPQAFLGIAFGWGAVMAWGAVRNDIGAPAVFIFLANILWSTAYDTIYALMDKEDDLKIGVKSTAILFGKGVYKTLALLYIGAAAFLAAAGYAAGRGWIYFFGVGLCLVLSMKVVSTVKASPMRETAFNGFLANAAIGGVMFIFVVIDTLKFL